MKLGETITLEITNPKDSLGAEVSLTGIQFIWDTDAEYVTLTPGAGGLTCAVWGAAIGDANITATAYIDGVKLVDALGNTIQTVYAISVADPALAVFDIEPVTA